MNKSLLQSWMGGNWNPNRTLDEMQKALATTNLTGYGNATPLLLENLDQMMTEVLITSAHLKLFQSIPRVPSIQPLYQWIRHQAYGTARRAPGFREGGAPSSGVSKWQRGQMLNKFMGVRRGVTHPAMITGQMGGAFIDPVQSENRDGTLQLLEMIERWLISGDKNILDGSGNEVNYDGLYLQLVADGGKSIIDKRGDPMDFEDLENAGTQLVERGFLLDFSKVMSMWNPFVLGDLAKLRSEERRV